MSKKLLSSFNFQKNIFVAEISLSNFDAFSSYFVLSFQVFLKYGRTTTILTNLLIWEKILPFLAKKYTYNSFWHPFYFFC